MQDTLLTVAKDNNPTMRDDLARLLTEAKIYVKADQETAYVNVVNVMNEIGAVGFNKVSLVAEEAAF
jgi:biopolymer transport protein ExbD